ncbi:MAG TPA: glycosyltransferase family 1 protein [Chloroflexota bacterium]|jgi:glycosyltransferase involved in cell wall biosynthesis|nr:glycosyltransferase family 1 protein [Chloroflexota bacterium]
MRIALNAQLLSFTESYRSGGISRVIYHLLAELGRDSRGHLFDVFAPTAPNSEQFKQLRFHPSGEQTIKPSRRILWEQTVLPRQLKALKPDLFHGLAYALPIAYNGPSVVTIYDLSFLQFPRAFNAANRIYLAATTRAAARRARRILTISESTRRDIVRLLSVPEDRVEVTYPAVEERYRLLPSADVGAFRVARGLPDTFIFAVGTLEPRKNLVGLLEAYARLSAPRPKLYVAGGTGWRFSPIFDTVQRLGLADQVTFLGFVPEDELPLWYNAARLFAFPSLYEGFGLPVLEAMACGTPVVTSTAASLPEVAGQAARLVAPHDTDGLAHEMQHVLDDPQTQLEMRAAGRIQASRFSWRAMTDQTVASYVQAVRG